MVLITSVFVSCSPTTPTRTRTSLPMPQSVRPARPEQPTVLHHLLGTRRFHLDADAHSGVSPARYKRNGCLLTPRAAVGERPEARAANLAALQGRGRVPGGAAREGRRPVPQINHTGPPARRPHCLPPAPFCVSWGHLSPLQPPNNSQTTLLLANTLGETSSKCTTTCERLMPLVVVL